MRRVLSIIALLAMASQSLPAFAQAPGQGDNGGPGGGEGGPGQRRPPGEGQGPRDRGPGGFGQGGPGERRPGEGFPGGPGRGQFGGDLNRPGRGGPGERGPGPGHQFRPEQRARITDAVRGLGFRPIPDLGVRLAIGAIVPRRAELHELPPELFDIIPEYRGYLCADTPDGLVIVDPDTLEIVDIVPL